MTEIEGCDVSAAQGWDPKVHVLPDWPKVAAAGTVVFAFVKATEGNGSVDRAFWWNWPKARASLRYVGPYHFADPDPSLDNADAIAEATFFCRTVCGVDSDGKILPYPEDALPPALDIEQARKLHAGPEFTSWVRAFLETVVELTGRRPIVYTGGPFWDERDGIPDADTLDFFSRFVLWLAAYAVQPDKYLPPPWRSVGWTIWQCSGDFDWTGKPGTGWRVAGIVGNVDRNKFRGGVEDLSSLVEASKVSKPRPVEIDPGTGPQDWRPQTDARTVLEDLFGPLPLPDPDDA